MVKSPAALSTCKPVMESPPKPDLVTVKPAGMQTKSAGCGNPAGLQFPASLHRPFAFASVKVRVQVGPVAVITAVCVLLAGELSETLDAAVRVIFVTAATSV